MDTMTTAVEQTAGQGAATADPLPVYKAKEVPEHLRTITQLKAMRLKPAEGQEPVGFLSMYRRGHGWGRFPLYDPAGASPMRALSAKQQAAKDARRTCPECRVVQDYIIHSGYGRCQDCRRQADLAAQELQARTCSACRRVSSAPLARGIYGGRSCDPCRIRWAIREQIEQERIAAWNRTCRGGWRQDCTAQLWTDAEIAAARADGTWDTLPRRCPACQEAWEAGREQQRLQDIEDARLARVAREQELEGLAQWARAALDDDQVVVLDTETTGLNDEARIVEVTAISNRGSILLDTLLNPGEPIPPEATGIHGITDTMVSGSPGFGQILDQLTAVLDGRRCLIYNAGYDMGRLRWELLLHYRTTGRPDPEQGAAAWMKAHTFEDVMIPYSNWCGDFSDYWGDYAWQPLGGGHRALGDCQAVLLRLEEMAAPEAAPADPWQTGGHPVLPDLSPRGEPAG